MSPWACVCLDVCAWLHPLSCRVLPRVLPVLNPVLRPAGPLLFQTRAEARSLVVRVKDELNRWEEKLARGQWAPLESVLAQTKIKRVYTAAAGAGAAAAAVVALLGQKLVTNSIGWGFPAYYSFKAIERNAVISAMWDDKKQWLTYWVVYSFLHMTESTTSFFADKIRFYHQLKLALLIYLFHPKTEGARTLYEKVLKPFLFDKLAGPIDRLVGAANHVSTDDLKKGFFSAYDKVAGGAGSSGSSGESSSDGQKAGQAAAARADASKSPRDGTATPAKMQFA